MDWLTWILCYLGSIIIIMIGSKLKWFGGWFISEHWLFGINVPLTFLCFLFWPVRLLYVLALLITNWATKEE